VKPKRESDIELCIQSSEDILCILWVPGHFVNRRSCLLCRTRYTKKGLFLKQGRKEGNEEWKIMNGEWGMGKGESLKWGIFKSGNL